MSVLKYLMGGVTPYLRDRLTPLSGLLALLPSQLSEATKGVLEPSVVVDESQLKIYFTKADGDTDNTICLATATDIKGAWTISATPVIGKGYGGAPSNRQAHSSFVLKSGGYYYCFATNGYGFGSPGEDRNLYLYRSTDGMTFTDLGLVVDKTAVAGAVGFGNVSVAQNTVGNFEMLIEASDGTIWKTHRFSSAHIESDWAYTNALPSLQVVAGGMYGGMQHFYKNGAWHIFYHYASMAGNLPTVLGYAISTDLVTADIKESPMFGIEAHPYTPTDQLADPFIFQGNDGKSYLLAEYCSNSGTFAAQMWLWEYDGTFDELFDGLN